MGGIRGATILAVQILSFSAAASLLAVSASSACLPPTNSQGAVVLGQIDPANWPTYRDAEYGFSIRYPGEFRTAEVPCAHIVRGAAVTFIPTANLLAESAGRRTNLVEFSVSIGVIDHPAPYHLRPTPLTALHLTSGSDGQHCEIGGLHFAKSYSAEGAVGNRYETISYCTDYSGRHYEISLFLHTGNPSVYEPGSITVFNPDQLIGLFERMVRTFFPVGRIARPD